MSGTWQRKTSDGNISGPFAFEELAFLARRGKFRPEDLVREYESTTWKTASDVLVLRALFSARQLSPVADRTVSARPAEAAPNEPSTSHQEPLPPPISAETKAEPDTSKAWLAAAIIASATLLLLFVLLLIWGTREPPNMASGGSRADPEAVSAWGSDKETPEDSRTPAASADNTQPSTPTPDQPPSEKQTTAPDPSTPPPAKPGTAETNSNTADTGGQAAPAPQAIAPKPVDTKHREDFIAATALTDAVGQALSGANENQRPSAYQGRSAKGRADAIRRFGGDEQTENAVYRGLQWLAKHQSSNGSWSLDSFTDTPGCSCSAAGTDSDTAATALALLPFLGAGEIHEGSKYHSVVAKGLTWLMQDQIDDGSFRHEDSGTSYAHAMATLALCETYGMTHAPRLRGCAQQAVDHIVGAQHAAGGWRYRPGMPGDLSVTGWQIMALRSAQIGGLSIPQRTWTGADRFLNQVQCDRAGSTYGYLGPGDQTPCRTAIGLLCREYLGWKKNNPGLLLGNKILLDSPPVSRSPDIYYWYYGTLVMHHLEGPGWKRWNESMKAALLPLQATAGHETGSWKPQAEWDRVGGRLYMTALAICTLEVYYRYLPIYQPEQAPESR